MEEKGGSDGWPSCMDRVCGRPTGLTGLEDCHMQVRNRYIIYFTRILHNNIASFTIFVFEGAVAYHHTLKCVVFLNLSI